MCSRSFATRQLEYLEGKFRLHELMNSKKELAEIKEVPKRDYYNVRKVCTNPMDLTYLNMFYF
jgi:AMP deaminase